jgi:hypothetical protein
MQLEFVVAVRAGEIVVSGRSCDGHRPPFGSPALTAMADFSGTTANDQISRQVLSPGHDNHPVRTFVLPGLVLAIAGLGADTLKGAKGADHLIGGDRLVGATGRGPVLPAPQPREFAVGSCERPLKRARCALRA